MCLQEEGTRSYEVQLLACGQTPAGVSADLFRYLASAPAAQLPGLSWSAYAAGAVWMSTEQDEPRLALLWRSTTELQSCNPTAYLASAHIVGLGLDSQLYWGWFKAQPDPMVVLLRSWDQTAGMTPNPTHASD